MMISRYQPSPKLVCADYSSPNLEVAFLLDDFLLDEQLLLGYLLAGISYFR